MHLNVEDGEVSYAGIYSAGFADPCGARRVQVAQMADAAVSDCRCGKGSTRSAKYSGSVSCESFGLCLLCLLPLLVTFPNGHAKIAIDLAFGRDRIGIRVLKGEYRMSCGIDPPKIERCSDATLPPQAWQWGETLRTRIGHLGHDS